jgi:hypothetical protein
MYAACSNMACHLKEIYDYDGFKHKIKLHNIGVKRPPVQQNEPFKGI